MPIYRTPEAREKEWRAKVKAREARQKAALARQPGPPVSQLDRIIRESASEDEAKWRIREGRQYEASAGIVKTSYKDADGRIVTRAEPVDWRNIQP